MVLESDLSAPVSTAGGVVVHPHGVGGFRGKWLGSVTG